MTTAFDIRMSALALRLVEQYGTPCVFQDVTAEPYDPATLTATPTTVNVTRKAAGPQKRRFFDPGDTTRGEDMVLILAASGLTFTPTRGRKVQAHGQVWTITDFEEIRAQDDATAYFITVKL